MSNLALYYLSLLVVLAPLLGCLLAGLTGQQIGRRGAHWVTIIGVGSSFLLSSYLLYSMLFAGTESVELSIYDWVTVGNIHMELGFLLDRLTVLMMVVVTFVSLMVHIFTIGYMHDDPGYQRFFSYIALFTAAMLILVMANNFLQLFFGWEAVGLVSYLLIGFWFNKESAIFANLKAFLVNRVGDFGFLLGIAAVFMLFHSINYLEIFAKMRGEGLSAILTQHIEIFGHSFAFINVICVCLFIGAMGKSAQIPLHVWLPDSMEGPTPISALIHAATMVTAGVFMVARMSPLYEYSEVTRSFILVIGGSTALFMGLLGIVQHDIKRVIAYSTLSQLGYMMVALGSSAYAVGIFHLMTHACFKALLFLGAGSVIIGLHHEQDMRKMGNLKKYMPITYLTTLIGGLALIGFPLFSGFYSKDMIIDAVKQADLPGAGFAYFAVASSVFVTALYTFRMIFLVFHTQEREDPKILAHLSESPAVVWIPLVLLAIPSFMIGALAVHSLLFARFGGFFQNSLVVLPPHNVLRHLAGAFHGALDMGLAGFLQLPFYLGLTGIVVAWVCYVKYPVIPQIISQKVNWLYKIMLNKYGFDNFNNLIIARGTRWLGNKLFVVGDGKLIDGYAVNGSAKLVKATSGIVRRFQTGYLYQYALVIIVGLLACLFWVVRI